MNHHKKIIETDNLNDGFNADFIQEIADPKLIPSKFEDLILQKGYDVLQETALRCPCAEKAAKQGLINCRNCGSTGWIFVSKTKTRAFVLGFGTKVPYKDWSATQIDKVTIVTNPTNRISYMDRFTVLDLESDFSQLIYPRSYKDKLIAYLIYPTINVLVLYQFVSPDKPLKVLIDQKNDPINWDYKWKENSNHIEFNTEKFDINSLRYQMTIGYRHHPVFHVIELNREFMRTPVDNCGETGRNLGDMPIKATAQRAHYILDPDNLNGDLYLFDNTVYP
ncbi:MAG: hypothetical protein SFU98_15800 [Leptospiraceae bacterium]|nr:hypothetical protein [Leptospiraceae bacterium]